MISLALRFAGYFALLNLFLLDRVTHKALRRSASPSVMATASLQSLAQEWFTQLLPAALEPHSSPRWTSQAPFQLSDSRAKHGGSFGLTRGGENTRGWNTISSYLGSTVCLRYAGEKRPARTVPPSAHLETLWPRFFLSPGGKPRGWGVILETRCIFLVDLILKSNDKAIWVVFLKFWLFFSCVFSRWMKHSGVFRFT